MTGSEKPVDPRRSEPLESYATPTTAVDLAPLPLAMGAGGLGGAALAGGVIWLGAPLATGVVAGAALGLGWWLWRGGPTAQSVLAGLRRAVPPDGAKVTISSGIIQVEGTFQADGIAARQLAWDLHIELETRIATQPLSDESGVLEVALSSLYRLYEYTRERLHAVGPPPPASPDPNLQSVQDLAVQMLNGGLRDFLALWHPRLPAPLEGAPAETAQAQAETAWDQRSACRQELAELQQELQVLSAELRRLAVETR